MGSGRLVTVGSPRMGRVGRQDHVSPIRPQRTLLRAREPVPNSGEPATHRGIQVRKMRLAVGNVGRKCAEMRENLVFALGEYDVPELLARGRMVLAASLWPLSLHHCCMAF
jgi:hypothetical protein